MGAHEVTCKSDSQLVVGQIKGEFEVKEPLLQRYYHTVSNLIARLKRVTVEHIHREENTRSMPYLGSLQLRRRATNDLWYKFI